MLVKGQACKLRRFTLSDAAAALSRLAMADVAMETSWKELWSWTERAVRQETSLEVFAFSVGLDRVVHSAELCHLACLVSLKTAKSVLSELTVCSGFQSKRVSLH